MGAGSALLSRRSAPRGPPLPVADINVRALSEVLEQVKNSLRKTGERHPANGVIPARAVNTLGEVMDSEWFVNRHGTRHDDRRTAAWVW